MSPRNGGGRFHRQSAADTFGEPDRNAGVVSVDVGRGKAVTVPVGADFVNTLEILARENNYGGYFKVYVNTKEIINPQDAPSKFAAGMRVAITSYDKVGIGYWKVA